MTVRDKVFADALLSSLDRDAVRSTPQNVNVEEETLHRFIVMGRKSLPDPSQRGAPYWGFVEMVTKDPEDLKTALRGGTSWPSMCPG